MQVHAVSFYVVFSLLGFKTNNTATIKAHGGLQGREGDAAKGGEVSTRSFSI
jgi:hypothetical protein